MNFSRISAKVDDPKVGQGEIFFLLSDMSYAKKKNLTLPIFILKRWRNCQEIILQAKKCTCSAINSNGFTLKNSFWKKGEAFLS